MRKIISIDEFHDGLAVALLDNGKYNFVNNENKLLTNHEFKTAHDFEKGVSVVLFDYHNYNLIDTKGNLISNENFLYVEAFPKYDYRLVMMENYQYNFMNNRGDFLCDKNLTFALSFKDNGIAEVMDIDSNITYFINTDGSPVNSTKESKIDFSDISIPKGVKFNFKYPKEFDHVKKIID